MKPQEPAFTYRARVVSVYDGDTMTVDIDLGFGVWIASQKLRLYGIDTPEMRGTERPDGLYVRDWVRAEIPDGAEIMVQTIRDKTGKYGRWLAVIWTDHGLSLNQRLLDGGMARSY